MQQSRARDKSLPTCAGICHMCFIPYDYIAPRQWELLMAQWVLTKARDGRATC